MPDNPSGRAMQDRSACRPPGADGRRNPPAAGDCVGRAAMNRAVHSVRHCLGDQLPGGGAGQSHAPFDLSSNPPTITIEAGDRRARGNSPMIWSSKPWLSQFAAGRTPVARQVAFTASGWSARPSRPGGGPAGGSTKRRSRRTGSGRTTGTSPAQNSGGERIDFHALHSFLSRLGDRERVPRSCSGWPGIRR
jgi:hypothetical protein